MAMVSRTMISSTGVVWTSDYFTALRIYEGIERAAPPQWRIGHSLDAVYVVRTN